MLLHFNSKDITGQKFNMLTALRVAGSGRRGLVWECQCDCGTVKSVNGAALRKNGIKSCGCLRRDTARRLPRTTHGMTDTPSYYAWQNMRQRCGNPSAPEYEHYGGRGITVCQSWATSFEAFFADMGVRPDGKSLDRIDPNGNYEKGNCRWATTTEQNRNKRHQFRIEFRGRLMTVAECCDLHGIPRRRAAYIYSRLRDGWSVDRTFSTPVVRGVRAGYPAVQLAQRASEA